MHFNRWELLCLEADALGFRAERTQGSSRQPFPLLQRRTTAWPRPWPTTPTSCLLHLLPHLRALLLISQRKEKRELSRSHHHHLSTPPKVHQDPCLSGSKAQGTSSCPAQSSGHLSRKDSGGEAGASQGHRVPPALPCSACPRGQPSQPTGHFTATCAVQRRPFPSAAQRAFRPGRPFSEPQPSTGQAPSQPLPHPMSPNEEDRSGPGLQDPRDLPKAAGTQGPTQASGLQPPSSQAARSARWSPRGAVRGADDALRPAWPRRGR